MEILGYICLTIIIVLAVGVVVRLASILHKEAIESCVDPKAPPEVQEQQRKQAELEITRAQMLSGSMYQL